MKFEYKTTQGKFKGHQANATYHETTDDPIMPEGDNWRLVAATINHAAMFWFWEREVAVEEVVTHLQAIG
jgi:hypothetical protein